MYVKLLTSEESLNEQIHNAALAMLTCTNSEGNMDKAGFDPVDRLKKIIEFGHESILEHINMTFRIEGISRAVLQELARHRHTSPSVQSTRRSLKKCVDSKEFMEDMNDRVKGLLARIRVTNEEEEQALFRIVKSVDDISKNISTLLNVKDKDGKPANNADILKYFLPELWPTTLVLTVNLRELRHIFELRTAPAALWEFQDLCRAIKNVLPVKVQELVVA